MYDGGEFNNSHDYESNLATQPENDDIRLEMNDSINILFTKNTETVSLNSNIENSIDEINNDSINVTIEGNDFYNDDNEDENNNQFDLGNVVSAKFPLMKFQFWKEETFLSDFLQNKKYQSESILRISLLREFGFIVDDNQQRSNSFAIQNNEAEVYLHDKRNSTFSLRPLNIKRIWKIRECTRFLHSQTYNQVEDDGPLSLVYHQVLSLQAKAKSNEMIENIGSSSKILFITLFFYNQYAQKLSSILQPNMVLKLRNVPSVCFFPSSSSLFNLKNYMNGTNSLEIIADKQSIPIPYVICIGDESKLDSDKKGEKRRFDDNIQISVESSTSRWEINSETFSKIDENSGLMTQEEININSKEPSVIAKQKQFYLPAFKHKPDLDDDINDNVFDYNSEIEEHIKMIEKGNIKKNTNKNASKCIKTNNAPIEKLLSTNESSDRNQITPLPYEYKIDKTVYHYLRGLRNQFHNSNQRVLDKRKFNCYAVVLSFTPPQMTRKKDWTMSITLTDDSLCSLQTISSVSTTSDGVSMIGSNPRTQQMTLNIFAKNKSSLPSLSCAGNVIRCHRILLQEWNDDVQLIGLQLSSYVVLSRKEPIDRFHFSELNYDTIMKKIGDHGKKSNCEYSNDCDPFPEQDWISISTAKKSSSFSVAQRHRFRELWLWGLLRLSKFDTLFNFNQKMTIAKLETAGVILEKESAALTQNQIPHMKVEGDLAVMVTNIIPNFDDLPYTPIGFLRVWDGTGASITDVHPLTAQPISCTELSSALLQSVTWIAHKISLFKNENEFVTHPQYFTGKIVNVAIWEKSHWHLIEKKIIKIGSFLSLRNVFDGRFFNTQRGLMINAKSSLTPLPDLAYEVQIILQNHQKRIALKNKSNPNSDVQTLKEIERIIVSNSHDSLSNPKHGDEYTNSNQMHFLRENQYVSLDICLGEKKPGFFDVVFRVIRTHPSMTLLNNEDNLDGLKCFCVPSLDDSDFIIEKSNTSKQEISNFLFRFIMTIYDETAELDVIIYNKLAQTLLHVTADEIMSKNSSSEVKQQTARSKCQERFNLLSTQIWKGKIQSKYMGKVKYFLLDSCFLIE